MKIKIVKCGKPVLWYKDMVGRTFQATKDEYDDFEINHPVDVDDINRELGLNSDGYIINGEDVETVETIHKED